MWTVNVLTIFPAMFPGPLSYSVIKRALEQGIWHINVIDIRSFVQSNCHIDDTPYGGGPGMVMRADVIGKAIESIPEYRKTHFIHMSPRGKLFTQDKAQELITHKNITILCSRFEGVDQRVLTAYDFEEISLGDYVICGGELAAMVMLEACIRLLPSVVGNAVSIAQESFSTSLLEYPHYTRPVKWRDLTVPNVLRSGNHQEIAQWRYNQSQVLTKKRRKDLWQLYLNKGNIHDKSS